MTRETKISLLVGLAFIIVIGILLSDHFHATQELPQAVITDVGDAVRRSMNEPGTGNPPINFVAPTDNTPTASVPTHDELVQPVSPVVPSQNYSHQPVAENPPPAPAENHGADSPAPDAALANTANKYGEPIIPANPDGSAPQDNGAIAQAPPASANPAPVAGPTQYRAEDGDSVSRMAAKFLGGNTRANRQAIIDANPSLQDDPDRVIVGKTYSIPTSPAADSNTVAEAPQANPPASAGGEYFYTVQEGDSLWQIANDQLGDPSAVEAIKDLNQGILKGDNGDVVTPGMKLRLPAKPVANAGNN